MITEDYVSFETAKLLEEKGFDVPTWTRYEDDNEVIFGDKYNWNNSPMGQISAPTLAMAMKWLRKVHKIDVWVEGWNRRYKGYIHSEQRGEEALFYEDSYEVACEAAIRHCLENLI